MQKKVKADIVNKTEHDEIEKKGENELNEHNQNSGIKMNLENKKEECPSEHCKDVSYCEDNENLVNKENSVQSPNNEEKPIVANGESKLLTATTPDIEKCDICGQFLNNSDIIYYQGHPQNAVEEFIALTNEKLLLASGKYLFS